MANLKKEHTVEELIDALKECDPKAVVVLSSDAEGNSYHALGFIEKVAKDDLVGDRPSVTLIPSHAHLGDGI